ncbi:hypothetical protein K431DRAFT_287835 [Polychaeton citri CBS 116435]|uniref:6-phosphogluconate dehydrogenase n=1 Tax=Polychaeton citri CBS 116435 TaxID=1314669 RepID=A0A9P4ULV3_9PEZI|nr:hypothetical protein K431DRAFT_287835 [Polychaeton citri CBS 116435]
MSTPKLAWIGLGNMGRGMVKNIAEKGNYSGEMLLYNRTVKRAEDLAASLPSGKARAVTSIADAVKGANIIFTCVANDQSVIDTIDAALQEPSSKGKLFVDCSTIHPDTTEKVTKTITDAGAQFVACPVFGAPAMADAGQLITVLAGPGTSIDKLRPFCKGVIARAEVDLSDQPQRTATLLKVIGNTFIFNMVETLAEGHAVSEATGLGSKNLHAFVEALFPGPYAAYSTRLMTGDYYKRDAPLFGVDLARKDIRHALNLADNVGVKMRGLEVADEHLKAVQEHQGEKGDVASIYGAVRKESGMKYEV